MERFLMLLTTNSGGGFERPAGDPDLAHVIYQVFDWMRNNEIIFYFSGHRFHYNYWQVFVGFLVFWFLADLVGLIFNAFSAGVKDSGY